jgi:hypothetical protein
VINKNNGNDFKNNNNYLTSTETDLNEKDEVTFEN